MLSPKVLDLIKRTVAELGLGAGAHTLEFGARSVPFSAPLTMRAAPGAPKPSVARRAVGDMAPEGDPAEGEPDGPEAPTSEMTVYRLSGTASSTSVDWYGTEMSRPCLDDMAVQFTEGVEVFVGHGSWMEGLEWDKAIGITDAAEVRDAAVVNAADAGEPGAVCAVEMVFAFDGDTPAAIRDAIQLLRQRVQMGRKTGLSIGGWFRNVQYIVNEEGELERIIIHKVDLDHLATTRSPANPDCLDLAEVRSVLSSAVAAARAALQPAAPVEPAPEAALPDVRTVPPVEPTSSVLSTPSATPAEPSPTETRSVAQPNQEIDMTPEQLQAEIDAAIKRALAERGLGTPPAPVPTPSADQSLDDAHRRGQPAKAPEPSTPVLQAPAGADMVRVKRVRSIIFDNGTFKDPGSSDKLFNAEIMRAVHFGDTTVNPELAVAYREPSGQRQKAMWLGLSHELRQVGANALADLAERSAPILGIELRGARGLRKNDPQLEADKALVDSEARALLVEAIRSAAADGHPVYKEPGTREAATRALTVSATSDKVTTALVSSLLQQLSNLQLGARTQLRRIPGAGTAYQTPNRTVSNTLAEFVADGSAPTEDSGTWSYDTWSYKTLATRIKVTRKARAQGAQWGDLLASEAINKAEDFNKQEEVAIFQGDTVHSLPTANGFNGLLTLVGAVSGQTVANTTANAGDVLSTQQLDTTIRKVRGRENKANLRIFASETGHILLNTVLQVTQQFTNQAMVQAGFVVETYNGIPIVESSGIPDTLVWNGTDARVTKWTTGSTTAIVVVNLTHVYMVVLTPVTMEQVAVTTAQYTEYEMYTDEVLVFDNSYGAAILGGIIVS